MQYARPPSGFIIREVETIKQLIDGSTAEWPRLPAYWNDVKKRLSMDGHRVGKPATALRSRSSHVRRRRRCPGWAAYALDRLSRARGHDFVSHSLCKGAPCLTNRRLPPCTAPAEASQEFSAGFHHVRCAAVNNRPRNNGSACFSP